MSIRFSPFLRQFWREWTGVGWCSIAVDGTLSLPSYPLCDRGLCAINDGVSMFAGNEEIKISEDGGDGDAAPPSLAAQAVEDTVLSTVELLLQMTRLCISTELVSSVSHMSSMLSSNKQAAIADRLSRLSRLASSAHNSQLTPSDSIIQGYFRYHRSDRRLETATVAVLLQ